MTDEERQRTMDFILQQQARTTAHAEELQEYRKRNESQREAFQKSFVQLVELARITDERLDNGDYRITAVDDRSTVLETKSAALAASMAHLAEAQAHADERVARVTESQARSDEGLARLREAQAHADERVSALIDIILESRNGPS